VRWPLGKGITIGVGVSFVFLVVSLVAEYRSIGSAAGARTPMFVVLTSLAAAALLSLLGLAIRQSWEREALLEREMRREKHLFSTVLDNFPDGIFFKDAEGRFTRINPALAQRLELEDPAEAIGKTDADFFDAEHAESVRNDEQEVMSSGQPILNKEKLESSEMLGDAWVSTSRFPLRDVDDGMVGTFGIARDLTGRKYTEQALENANKQLTGWVAELETRGQEMILLSEMGELLQTCLNEEEAQKVINRYAEQLFGSMSGTLALMKASRNFVESVATWGESQSSESIFPPDHCWALRRGHVQHGVPGDAHVRCIHVTKELHGSYLCVPMMAQGEAIGVLHLSFDVQSLDFRPDQKRLASTFAERVGLALANLRLREALRLQSVRDPLTGLFNRRYMEESLEREIRRAARKNKSVGAIMVDLDHFKRFNDTFGHEAGDMLLREFGNLARAKTRKEDIACRYGGEEFLIIMPEATLENTQRRAEELREAVKHLELTSGGRPIGMVTASLGVAAFPDHAQTVEALVRVADAALYEAKHSGRDRVLVAAEVCA
jgi:diguanylate cyclase (GGDEF)-like protein/PAS domain S-box-containing protein